MNHAYGLNDVIELTCQCEVPCNPDSAGQTPYKTIFEEKPKTKKVNGKEKEK
jgi:hypothetical protein